MTNNTQHSWKSVRDTIHQKILNSTYGPGDKLPKDEDLASELGCARTTVQRAMRNLVDSGIVERRRKGGTRVRIDPVTRATLDIPITRKEVESKGCIHGYQLTKISSKPIPVNIVANFGLTSPETMLNVQALHLADQKPYIYEDRWVSTNTVPEILTVDLRKESANEWLVRNRPYSRAEIRFYAIKASSKLAAILETNPAEALFVMERTTWIGSKPITSVKAITAPGYQLITRVS